MRNFSIPVEKTYDFFQNNFFWSKGALFISWKHFGLEKAFWEVLGFWELWDFSGKQKIFDTLEKSTVQVI